MQKKASELSAGLYNARIKVLLALSVCLSFAAPYALGEAVSWSELLDQGRQLGQNGKAEEAERVLKTALKEIDSDKSIEELDPRKALILAPLAAIAVSRSQYVEAEVFYKRALSVCEDAYGPDDANVGAVLAQLASLYYKQKRYAEAEPFFNRAIAIRRKTDQKQNPELARLLVELGTLYFKQYKSSEAKELFIEAEKIFKTTLGPEDRTVAEALSFQALLCRQTHSYVEAEQILKRVLLINEKTLKPDSPELAQTLDSLSSVYLSQGRYADAAPLLQRVITITEKVYGSNSKNYAACLESKAVLELSLGNYPECEKFARQALAIQEKESGSDSVDISGSLRTLATMYLIQRKETEAMPILERMLVLQKKGGSQSSSQNSFTMSKLANIYFHQKKYEKAEELYRSLLNKDKNRLGENSPVVASDQSALAKVLEAQGKNVEAEELRNIALSIKKALPGSTRLAQRELPVKIGTGSVSAALYPADKWALVVGISNFKNPSLNLQYAAKDARDFSRFLITEANFKADHVKLLVDSQASHENVVADLGAKWLGKMVKRNDLVLVYISSHGSEAADDAKGTNFLLTYDTDEKNLLLNGIPMQWLTAGISKQIPSDRIVLILDVCHAGAAQLPAQNVIAAAQIDGQEKGAGEAGKNLIVVNTVPPGPDRRERSRERGFGEFNVDELVLGKGQILIASSDANQNSYESKNYKNGVFTYQLMEGLRQDGPDTTLSAALNYMKERVEEEVLRDRSKIQTPVVLQDWKGSDIVIGVKSGM